MKRFIYKKEIPFVQSVSFKQKFLMEKSFNVFSMKALLFFLLFNKKLITEKYHTGFRKISINLLLFSFQLI